MEATGVYWKPVWNILSDGTFELIVANAAHIKNVPGRKTDVNDATWIGDLVACGLIRASFVPDEAIQQLRSLLRARKQLSREQTSHIQRIQKTLEEANIKLDSVISDVLGVSGRRMIEAMIHEPHTGNDHRFVDVQAGHPLMHDFHSSILSIAGPPVVGPYEDEL